MGGVSQMFRNFVAKNHLIYDGSINITTCEGHESATGDGGRGGGAHEGRCLACGVPSAAACAGSL